MKSRKLRAALCALVCLLLLSLLSGCGAGALIQGQWTDSSGSLSMTLGKDGKGIVAAVADALPVGQYDDNRWNQRLTKGGDADAQDGL